MDTESSSSCHDNFGLSPEFRLQLYKENARAAALFDSWSRRRTNQPTERQFETTVTLSMEKDARKDDSEYMKAESHGLVVAV